MLNIAKTIYIAYNTPSVDNLPEVEVIPFGNTPGEKNKLSKLTKKYANVAEYENIPLPGFTLSDIKHQSQYETKWNVIDPRGFLVTITSRNLSNILSVTGITEGLIQQRCVWIRDDAQSKMTLMPITSEDYETIVNNTKLIEEKVNSKDVQIGDDVLLQNGLTGKYMGVLSLYGDISEYSIHKSVPAYLRRMIVEISTGTYHYQTDVKILNVIKKTENPMTRDESAAYINDTISNMPTYFTTSNIVPSILNIPQYYYRPIKHVSTYAVAKPKISLSEMTLGEASDTIKGMLSRKVNGCITLEYAGYNYILNFNTWSYNNLSADIDSEPLNVIRIGELIDNEYFDGVFDTSYRYVSIKLSEASKIYKVTKHVKNYSYI